MFLLAVCLTLGVIDYFYWSGLFDLVYCVLRHVCFCVVYVGFYVIVSLGSCIFTLFSFPIFRLFYVSFCYGCNYGYLAFCFFCVYIMRGLLPLPCVKAF